MERRTLLELPWGETLLSAGAVLADFEPEEGESAESLKRRAAMAVKEGRMLGVAKEGSVVLEPLLRRRTGQARRSPGEEDYALDGWRAVLSLTFADWPSPCVLPCLETRREKEGLCMLPGREPGRPLTLTWIGELPEGLVSFTMKKALPAGPVTMKLCRGGEVTCAFEAAGDFAVRRHPEAETGEAG